MAQPISRRDLIKGLSAVAATSFVAVAAETPAWAETPKLPDNASEQFPDVYVLRINSNDVLAVIAPEYINHPRQIRNYSDSVNYWLKARGHDLDIIVFPPGSELQVIQKNDRM